MAALSVAQPPTIDGARGGKAATAEGDDGGVVGLTRLHLCARVTNANRPCLPRLWAAIEAQIAAEVDEGAWEADAVPLEGDIRSPALGDAAQVEPDTRRQANRSTLRVQHDRTPATTALRRTRQGGALRRGRRFAAGDLCVVLVVAQRLDLMQQRRVEESAGASCRFQGERDAGEEQLGDRDLLTGRVVEPAQLAL